MALGKCKECGNEISKKASACPKCGAPAKKKTSASTWVVVIVLIFVGISYLGSEDSTNSDSQNSSDTTPTVHKMGKTVHIGYTSYAVWKAWYSNRLSSNQFINQKPDANFLFISITVRNDDDKARNIPPFKLVDSNGAEYDSSSKAWAVDGSIGALDSLNPGVSKQGFIVFDVPKGKKYRLKLSGGYWSSDNAFVQINTTSK